jgi:hypothetical protein
MSTEEKLDAILKNQGIIIQMLSDVLEAKRQRPDLKTAMAPILENPLFKNNPAVQNMLGALMKNMGGSHE